MSNVNFQLVGSKVVEHYILLKAKNVGNNINEPHITLLKNITNNDIKEAIYETHKKFGEDSAELSGNNEAVIRDNFSGLVILKHNDTDTTIVVEMAAIDHDGNDFSLYDENNKNYVEITEETQFTPENIKQLLTGVVKYDEPVTLVDNSITFEPSNTCWVDDLHACMSSSNSEVDFNELDKKADILEDRINGLSFIEVLLNDYKGKVVHTVVDECGGIMEIDELASLDDLDYIRIKYCL